MSRRLKTCYATIRQNGQGLRCRPSAWAVFSPWMALLARCSAGSISMSCLASWFACWGPVDAARPPCSKSSPDSSPRAAAKCWSRGGRWSNPVPIAAWFFRRMRFSPGSPWLKTSPSVAKAACQERRWRLKWTATWRWWGWALFATTCQSNFPVA